MQTRSSPSLALLHRLAKQVSIEGYERMPKSKLFQQLKGHFNFDRIRRMELRAHKSSESSESTSNLLTSKKRKEREPAEENKPSKTSKKEVLNTLDPIMMVPIGKKRTFCFTRPNGTKVLFLVESLADYLLSSGDFYDPETRIPFSDKDLQDIDDLVKEMGLKKTSVLAAKRNVKAYTDAKFRRDALLGLERCAGEVIAEMLEIVENSEPDEAQMELVMNEFPIFLDYFRQLKDADPEYASKCMAHWKLFMAGPPNRPNRDDYGLINVICRFLKGCEDGQI